MATGVRPGHRVRVRIGPYEVLSELGRGGMGVVYRARAPGGGEAALKLLLRADAAAFTRFQREARILSTLGEAEGFVGLRDAGSSGPAAWLVMPLVVGGTLRRRLQAGLLTVEETIALGVRLARALGVAHERGIVHRDVKPENVLFTADGRPLLADLGLAKHFDRRAPGASQSVEVTEHGTFKGTASYAAPEQVACAATVGPAADVFSLGAVLYECLTGRRPFMAETLLEVLTKLSSGTVPPIGLASVPPWLERAVMKALARDPGARFEGGAEFARALERRGAGGRPGRRARLAAVVSGTALGAILLGGFVSLRDRTARSGQARPIARGASVPRTARPPTSAVDELIARADERLGAHDAAGALAAGTKAVELAPENPNAWYEQGVARIGTGDWKGAVSDLTRAIELAPDLSAAWCERGAARGLLGDVDGDLADQTKAVALDPRLARAWCDRGVAWGLKGNVDRWVEDETRAIEVDASYARAWVERGLARARKGDFKGELADETRAIDLAPRCHQAWAARGIARLATGDLKAAIADETKAIELVPTWLQAWVERGVARGATGDWDGEIEDETKAIELDPRVPEAWAARGHARCGRGDWTGAIADNTRAIELDKGCGIPQAWAVRGRARFQAADFPGAIRDLERFLELAPHDSDCTEARRELAEARRRAP